MTMAAKTKQATQTKAGGAGNTATQTANESGNATSAIEMLKQDHRKVEGLFKQFEQAGDDDDNDKKQRLVEQICEELIIHMRLEEGIFYPACRDLGVQTDTMDEAQVEHDSAKALLNDLVESHSDSPYWEAKVSVLKEMIQHHVQEEEEPKDGTFAQAKAHNIDDSGLARRLKEAKEELHDHEVGRRPIRIVSIHPEQMGGGAVGSSYGQRQRGSRSGYEDDERYGDARRYGGGDGYERGRGEEGRYGGNPNQQQDRYRGPYGRGQQGDDQDDRHYGRERDEQGRFTGNDDDQRRRSGGYGGGPGWHGDPRGHAEASRRGWEERGHYSARYREDDDDRRQGERSGWYGDSRGHAAAARRGWQGRR